MSAIYSMTGFAREALHHALGTVSVEIRTVNHRFLDQKIHLPDSLRAFEQAIRGCIKKHLHRGKLDCHIRFQPVASESEQLSINRPLAEQLVKVHHELGTLFDEPAKTHITRLMSWPHLIQATPLNLAALEKPLMALIGATLVKLLAHRAGEGRALKAVLITRLDTMDACLAQVLARLPGTIEQYRQKLHEAIQGFEVSLAPERLAQEVAMMAQKSDIAEEIDRLKTHLHEIRAMLQTPTEPVGRRLDFLLQELQREVNTIASKSIDSQITLQAVEMKVAIEQMREQGNNLE